MSQLKDLVDVMTRVLADQPEQVTITEAEHSGTTVIDVFLASGDLGRVIGRQGRTAAALRTLVDVAAEREGRKTTLEFHEARAG